MACLLLSFGIGHECQGQYVNFDPEPISVRALGMGGLALGSGDDPADAFTQPACLLGERGLRATAGGTVRMTRSGRDASFNELEHRWEENARWWAPGYAGAAYRWGSMPGGAAASLFVHRLASTERSEATEGYRHALPWTGTTRMSLGIDAVTGALAWGMRRSASVGMAVSMLRGGAERDYQQVYQGGEWRGNNRRYSFSGTCLALGARYSTDMMTGGLVLRLPSRLIETEEYSESVSDSLHGYIASSIYDSTLPARVTSIPAMAGFGLELRPGSRISLAMDLQWKPYSRARTRTTVRIGSATGPADRDTIFNCSWRDAFLVSIGAEYRPGWLRAPIRIGARNIAGPYRNFDRGKSLIDSLSARGLAFSAGTRVGSPNLAFDLGVEYARVVVEYLASHFPGQSVTDRLVDNQIKLALACTYRPSAARESLH